MTPPVTPPGPLEKSRRATMQWLLGFMDHLDRLGYVAAGFSLLALGMLIFVHAWYAFFLRSNDVPLLPAGLKLLNDLLLVIILLELFRTCGFFRPRCWNWSPIWRSASSPARDGC